MRIHHLALLSPAPAVLARWYVDTLGLREIRVHTDDLGVRSVWLDLEGAILMVERGAAGDPGGGGAAGESAGRGWQGTFLAVPPGSGASWSARLGPRVTGRTAYTLYAADPEGNRLGVSSYPQPLFEAPPPGT